MMIENTEVKDFTRLDGTKKFIEACLKTADLPFLDVKTEDDIITSRQKSGTFFLSITGCLPAKNRNTPY
jgi:hypothetical protein